MLQAMLFCVGLGNKDIVTPFDWKLIKYARY